MQPGFKTLSPRPRDHDWSADEAAWATDVMLISSHSLSAVYPDLVKHAVTQFGLPPPPATHPSHARSRRGRGKVVGSVVCGIAVFDDEACAQAGDFGGEAGGLDGSQNFVEVFVGRRGFIFRILPAVAENVVLVK